MPTQQEFAASIRTKYSAYQDIDDSTLVAKFVEKYPVYKDQISDFGQPLTTEQEQPELQIQPIEQGQQPTETIVEPITPLPIEQEPDPIRDMLSPETAVVYDAMRQKQTEVEPYQMDINADFGTQVKEASKETFSRLKNINLQTFTEIRRGSPSGVARIEESNDAFIEAFEPLLEALDPKKEDWIGKRLGKEVTLFAIMAPVIAGSMLDDPVKTTKGIAEFFLTITNDWIEAIRSPLDPLYNPVKTQAAREEIARTPLFHTIPFLGIGGAFKAKIGKLSPKSARELSTKLAKDVVKEGQKQRGLGEPFKPIEPFKPEDVSVTGKRRATEAIAKAEAERLKTVKDREIVEKGREKTIPEESKVTPKKPETITVEPKGVEQLKLIDEINAGLKDAGLAIKIKPKAEDVELTEALDKIGKGDKSPEVRDLIIKKLEAMDEKPRAVEEVVKAEPIQAEPTAVAKAEEKVEPTKPIEKVVEKPKEAPTILLEQDAKKYKSADEFYDSFNPSENGRKVGTAKEGEVVMFASSENVWFGHKGKQLKYNGSLSGEFEIIKHNPKTTLIKNKKSGDEYIVLKDAIASKDVSAVLENNILTKQGLIDFWNKSTKEVTAAKEAPVVPKVEEKPVEAKIEGKEGEPSQVITVEAIESSRLKAGLSKLPKEEAQKWADVLKGAEKRTDAVAIAESIRKKPRVLTNEEVLTLGLEKERIENLIDSSQKEISRAIDSGNKVEKSRHTNVQSNALVELDKITEAIRFHSRASGRALQFHRIALEREGELYKVASILQRAKVAKGERLTEIESNTLGKLGRKIDEMSKREVELTKEIGALQEILSKRDAKAEFARTSKTIPRKRTQTSLKRERADLFNDLNKIGYRLNDVIGLTYESATIVGKLAKNYFESGVKDLDAIVEKIQTKVPDMSKKDVYDSIGGRIKKTKRIVEKTTKQELAELRKEAKLMGQIEDAYKGVFDAVKKNKPAPKKIVDLQKKLTELKKQANKTVKDDAKLNDILLRIDNAKALLASGQRAVGAKPKPVDAVAIQKAKTKLAELNKLVNLRDTILDLEQQIKTGKRVVVKGKSVDSEIVKVAKEKVVELRKELRKKGQVLDIQEKIKTLQNQITTGRRDIKIQKAEVDPSIARAQQELSELRRLLTTKDKIADLEHQLITGDFKVPVKTRTVIKNADLIDTQVKLTKLRREVRERIHAMTPLTTGQKAIEWVTLPRTLMSMADVSMIARQGLAISARHPIQTAKFLPRSIQSFFSQNKADQIDVWIRKHPNQPTREQAGLFLSSIEKPLNTREEFFSSNLAERIPVWGKMAKASNRHAVTHLNFMRVASFDQFLKNYPNATNLELKTWARLVNIMSGRGDLGAFNRVANELSVVFFSPRFSVSRIQLPFEVLRPSNLKYPSVRKEMAKSIGSYLGLVGTLLFMADMAGLDVGTDPNSPDWLKIRDGDTRIDIFGGYLQSTRVLALAGLTALETRGFDFEGDPDLRSAVERFERYKQSPPVTMTFEFITGKTSIGEETTPLGTIRRAVTPFAFQDIVDTFKSEPKLLPIIAPLALSGVGINTYKKKFGIKRTKL